MRKKVFGRKLNRNRRSRASLFRSLAKSMIKHGVITTTRAKAKAVQPDLDRLMGMVTESTLAKRRSALSYLGNDREATDLLFSKYAKFAVGRNSGYTTIAALPPRKGDSAEMVRLSWVEVPEEEAKKQ